MSARKRRRVVARALAEVPRMPVTIVNAIEGQRRALVTVITLLHCLHSVLRRQIDDAGEDESDAVEDAVGWVELPDLTAMLLERVHQVHLALDSVSLKRALKESKT
jgi:hypothetical protein